MIDWVSAILPCYHAGKITNGVVLSVNGEVDWQVERRLSVRGSHEATISVRSKDSSTIELQGNPAKWLQGHNLFKCDDLTALVLATMERLTEILRLSPMDEDVDAWRGGKYTLSRADCTGMWELPKLADASA